jgi:hypothetical protein
MESTDYTHINGWGIDADPLNEPTYPMKKYTGDDHNRSNWLRPALQQEDDTVLKSNERPQVSAVFGSSVAPSGWSGKLRRYAFNFSESSYGHWLPLLLADRVNVVEGIMDDLKNRYVPNIFLEKGWKSEWKHNRKHMVVNIIATIAMTTFVIMTFRRKR